MYCLYVLTSHSLPDAIWHLCWNCFPQTTRPLDTWVFVVVVCLFVCSEWHSWPEFPWWSESEGIHTKVSLDPFEFPSLEFDTWAETHRERWVLSINWPSLFLWRKSPSVSSAQNPRAPVFPAPPEPGGSALHETLWAILYPGSSPFLF